MAEVAYTDIEKAPAQEVLTYEPAAAFRASPLQDDSGLADCKGKRIGILVVTYNAATTIHKVLRRITPNVWENVQEVVVFDDASQDSTYELAVGIKSITNIPKLKVLRHSRNLGYGGNQKAGYKYLIDQGFDIVVLLHGDGQYAPEILAHMYHPIVNGEADAVFGSRMMKTYGGPIKGGMPMYKYVGNRILTIFENASLGLNLTEFHSGYRAYNLHALKRIDLSILTNDFHFDTEIIIKLNHQNFHIAEVPIPTYYGDEICYVNGVKYAKNVFRAVHRYNLTKRSIRCFPEYKEYFVNNPLKQSLYSSHYMARQAIGTDQDVLDIGCGRGALSEAIAQSGNRVIGVDILAREDASQALAGYIQFNLADGCVGNLKQELGSRKFDQILLLDVLEHIANPEALLSVCAELLRPGGQLIVSVPNAAHLTVRLMLLCGNFNYSDRGILDRTHLRFFTRKTIGDLLASNGYSVIKRRMTLVPIELLFSFSPTGWFFRAVEQLLRLVTTLCPGLLGYQTFLLARPK